MRTDVYPGITHQIVSDLEDGVRPWSKPWNAEHAAGRTTRPLHGHGIPYQGLNVIMVWSAAMAERYARPCLPPSLLAGRCGLQIVLGIAALSWFALRISPGSGTAKYIASLYSRLRQEQNRRRM
jgi:hypothetical protein